MISRGLFNTTLTLQRIVISDDGMGGRVSAPADVGSFKGRISPLKASERIMQDKSTHTTTHRIFCDPMTVTPKDRIRWGTYYFEILTIINPSEMYHHLELDCREISDT